MLTILVQVVGFRVGDASFDHTLGNVCPSYTLFHNFHFYSLGRNPKYCITWSLPRSFAFWFYLPAGKAISCLERRCGLGRGETGHSLRLDISSQEEDLPLDLTFCLLTLRSLLLVFPTACVTLVYQLPSFLILRDLSPSHILPLCYFLLFWTY